MRFFWTELSAIGTEQNHWYRGHHPSQYTGRVKTIHHRHRKVHYNQVRMQLLSLFYCLLSVLCHALWQAPDHQRLKGKRDRALLALLIACGLRRHEAVALTLDHLQQREEHWAIVDLVGKGGRVRTVPVPDWVRSELDDWLHAAVIDRGRLFRRVNKVGKAWGEGITEKAVWHIVKESARSIGVEKLAPHDL